MLDRIEFLAWDSQFLGRRVGRLTLTAPTSLDETLLRADHLSYNLLYIYSPIRIEASVVGHYVLLDVGGHITFAKSLTNQSRVEVQHVPEIHEYQLETLTPEVLDVAYLSGHLSRFRIDPSLPAGTFERLYETWLANTIKNRPSSRLFAYQLDGMIAGLITSEMHGSTCTIGLLAVLEAYQGQGIATSLIKYVEAAGLHQAVTSMDVKTQLSNKGARALYLKNSFVERERSFLYHAHILD